MAKDKKKNIPPHLKPLDDREKLFVKYYLIHRNAEKAAILAGYTESTSRSNAYQWVCDNKHAVDFKPHVHAAVKKGIERIEKRLEITQDNILKELAKIAFLDIDSIYNKDGTIKNIHDIPKETLAAINGVEVESKRLGKLEVGKTKKIKLIDKKGALELLGKHLGMFKEKIGGLGDDTQILEIPIRFVKAPKRKDDE